MGTSREPEGPVLDPDAKKTKRRRLKVSEAMELLTQEERTADRMEAVTRSGASRRTRRIIFITRSPRSPACEACTGARRLREGVQPISCRSSKARRSHQVRDGAHRPHLFIASGRFTSPTSTSSPNSGPLPDRVGSRRYAGGLRAILTSRRTRSSSSTSRSSRPRRASRLRGRARSKRSPHRAEVNDDENIGPPLAHRARALLDGFVTAPEMHGSSCDRPAPTSASGSSLSSGPDLSRYILRETLGFCLHPCLATRAH